jgi:choline kinase
MKVNDFSLLLQDVVIQDPAQVQKLARKLGKTYATLVREANPYDGGAKLGADTLLKIMELSRDVRPLQYMAEQFGMTLVKDEGTSVRAGQHAAR